MIKISYNKKRSTDLKRKIIYGNMRGINYRNEEECHLSLW